MQPQRAVSERPSLSRLRPPPPAPPLRDQVPGPGPPSSGKSAGRTHHGGVPADGDVPAGQRQPGVPPAPPAPAPHPATRSSALAGRKESTRSTTSAKLLSTKAPRGSAEEPRSPPPPTSSIPPHRPREQDRGSDGLGDGRRARQARVRRRACPTSGAGLPAPSRPDAALPEARGHPAPAARPAGSHEFREAGRGGRFSPAVPTPVPRSPVSERPVPALRPGGPLRRGARAWAPRWCSQASRVPPAPPGRLSVRSRPLGREPGLTAAATPASSVPPPLPR